MAIFWVVKKEEVHESWVDFDFFGNQLSLHIGQTIQELESDSRVDNVEVPLPHFGCVLLTLG